MDKAEMLQLILDSIPYPIVFADENHIIRFLNKTARFHYYKMRGYKNLLGKSLLSCHNKDSQEKIIKAADKLKNHSNEIYAGVVGNNRLYINPVRNEAGDLVGYFERYEMNLQK